ncbi:MAG TPA: cyclophilin-like fold protein [bacterium]|nr:cyclophilin-like fold protein [bacterium]
MSRHAVRTITITAGKITATATLGAGRTADAIWNALPLEARASTWGDEIYFSIPVTCDPESPREVVEMGDLGYWPPGSAFCIFFGPTPASRDREIRPASPVNVFGRIQGDATVFKAVRSGTTVTIGRAG